MTAASTPDAAPRPATVGDDDLIYASLDVVAQIRKPLLEQIAALTAERDSLQRRNASLSAATNAILDDNARLERELAACRRRAEAAECALREARRTVLDLRESGRCEPDGDGRRYHGVDPLMEGGD